MRRDKDENVVFNKEDISNRATGWKRTRDKNLDSIPNNRENPS